MRTGVRSRALLRVIRGADVLRCLFAIRGESPCIFIGDFLLSFLDPLLSLFCATFFLLLSLMVISSFFRLLGSFLIYFFPGFSCSSWYRKEVSFWAYLEGDIVSVTLFRFLGGFGYDCFLDKRYRIRFLVG